MTPLVDTSVAVALLSRDHPRHGPLVARLGNRTYALAAHSALETYSVLTRLPGGARLAPRDAARVIGRRFPDVLALPVDRAATFIDELATTGVAGGAVYDALIAATAATHARTLSTRDGRAAATYAALGASVELIG